MKKVFTCTVSSSHAATVLHDIADSDPHGSAESDLPSLSTIPLRSAENDLPTLSQVPCGNVESDLPTHSTIPRSNMESNPSTVPRCDAETTPCPVLEVAVEDCGITTISMSTLKNVWNKAERLVCSGSGILKVPWSSDKKARLVMSSSSDHPHLVMIRSGKMQYSCDDKCAMFKGFSLCFSWSTTTKRSVALISQL